MANARAWFNTELAKKPPRALEYVVVHELAHIAVRRHGQELFALMDLVLPRWRLVRVELGALPLGHDIWRT